MEHYFKHLNSWRLWERQLITEYDQMNWAYRLNLTRPHIRIIDTKTLLGQWDPLLREIKISALLIESCPWFIVIEVLKHEIAHQLVSDRLGIEDGHGQHFKSFCQTLGVHPQFQKSQSAINFRELEFGVRRQESEGSSSPEEVRLLERVERLLSLAQSMNENEAAAAMEKVNALYEKYNWERRKQSSHRIDPYNFLIIDLGTHRVSFSYPLICTILTEHFFVETIFSSTFCPHTNKTIKTIELFGLEPNLKVAEYVLHFLRHKLDALWQQQKNVASLSAKHKRSYQIGLLHGFRQKLENAKKERHQQITEHSERMALQVLADDPNLDAFVQRRFPRLSRRRHSSGRVDHRAYHLGHEEGGRLIINKGIEKSAEVSKTKLLEYK